MIDVRPACLPAFAISSDISLAFFVLRSEPNEPICQVASSGKLYVFVALPKSQLETVPCPPMVSMGK